MRLEQIIDESILRVETIDMQPFRCIYACMKPEVYTALANENRRKLLDCLFEKNGQSLSELCDGIDMSRQAVTKHLKTCEAANLVSVKWHGREKLHFLNPIPLAEIVHRWVGRFEDARLEMLVELKHESESKEKKRHAI